MTGRIAVRTEGMMLRAFFLSLARVSWAQRMVTSMPPAWRAVSRFVASETLEGALPVVRQLNQAGLRVSLDHLGEHTSSRTDADQAVEQILLTLEAIDREGLAANVSIKLTQIGLGLTDEICRGNLARIAQAARDCKNFVRVDMEDSSVTERTLTAVREVRDQGYDNLGVVIQAALYRSEEDVRALLASGTPIRLCKGAYREPASVAFPRKKDVDANYDRLSTLILGYEQAHPSTRPNLDGRFPPAVALATHDPLRISFAQKLAANLGLPKETVEYQMLFGIRRELQYRLASEGRPVRVYVPFGTHWYPYFMRRLGERPANLWFVLSNLFRR